MPSTDRKSRKLFHRDLPLRSTDQDAFNDPFTLVYVRLWELLEGNSRFASLVPSNNRIKFFDIRHPQKSRMSDADTPEVAIQSSNAEINMFRDSCSTEIIRQYEILIRTGDQRMNERLHPLEWSIIAAMKDWKTELTGLTWYDLQFVSEARFVNPASSFFDDEEMRMLGWSAVWITEVVMDFPSGEMLLRSGP